MILRRFLFTFLILLTAFQLCLSQEKPKAVLIAEFGNDGRESLLQRMDYFYSELANDPESHGYIIIYGKDDDTAGKLTYELWINGSIHFRGFDPNRVNKIRGAEAEKLNIQFWKVPAGAEKPTFEEGKWNFSFPPNTKPYVFHDSYSDQICSYTSFEKVYAEYLNANPEAKGHIVIYEESRIKYLKKKKESQKLLSEIPQNRLRFFYVKGEDSNVEYWLVPKK